MSNQNVWVRCKVDDEAGLSHVLIKGHAIQVTEYVAATLEALGKVERIAEPQQAVDPPAAPKAEQRIARK